MKNLFVIFACAACAVTTARAQLFSDDFSRGTDPGPLTPWGTNAGGGNWTVTGGVMKGGLNPSLSYGFTFITNNFTNFSAQAQFQFPTNAFGGGLGGRLNITNGTHYAAWLYPENSVGDSNVLKIIRFDSYSSFTVLKSTNLTSVGTNTHIIKLEFAGTIINAYLDGARLLSTTDATYTNGAISLDFWTDANPYQMTVDNVVVNAPQVVANNDTYAAVLGMALNVSAPGVLTNDTGGNGSLTASLVTTAAHGTLTFNSNGSFTYNATNNFTGTDSFVYKATDGVTSSNATVTLNVSPDHPPVANNDNYSVLQNATLSVPAPGVLANDTDADGNSLTAVLVTGPSNGTLTLTNSGGFTYTPSAGFSGSDTFVYKANDGLSNSANATVTISVLAITPLYSDSFNRTNLAPWIAQTGNWAVTNSTLIGGTNTTFSYGVASITNIFTNYSVQANVQFPAGAFGGGIDACMNTATGARYSAWIYPEGSPGGGPTLKLIKFQTYSSFAYNGSSSLPIQSVNLSAVGTNSHTLKLACAGNRIGVFFDGILMITQSDIDSGGPAYTNGTIGADFWTDSTPYQMSVRNVLVASLVNPDTYSTYQNNALTVNAPGVLANDSEIYGASLSAVLLASPAHGTLSLGSDGSFVYTPTNGYVGADSFTYQANDNLNNIGSATVSITVMPGGFSENFDGVTAPALPSGWTTSATGVETPWVTRTTTNDTAPNAAYAPDPGNVGTSDLISPAIPIGTGQSRLSFRNNYALEADNKGFYDGGVLEIKIGAGAFTDILAAGGTFVSGGYNATISTLYSNALAGRQAWSSNSVGFITTLVDLPPAVAGQTIQLRWRCSTDNGNGSSLTNGWYIDTVSISNCPSSSCWNTPPILAAQPNYTVAELSTLTVTNTAADGDQPPQTLTYTLLVGPTNASISSSGVITWTPTAAQGPSTNTFTTRVTDNGSPALSATNTFEVVVQDVNIAPVLPNIAAQTVNELALMTITNTATEANPHATLSYTLVSPPSGAVISTNGIITWTPQQTQSPSTNTFTTIVTNTDALDPVNPHLSATNSFNVVVREVNVAPSLPAQADRTIGIQTTLTVTNAATNANIHSTILGYTLVSPPSGATISASGVISWTPSAPATNLITTVVTNSNPFDTINPKLTATNSFKVTVLGGPLLELDSATLASESCIPTNNVIDPGETVTVLFSLKNVGGANTTNLVVTLLQTNGIVPLSAPQTYGVLVMSGSSVSQPFTFAASGSCGSNMTAVLQLQDGSANLGMISNSFILGQSTVLTQNFDSVTAPALPAGWTTTNSGAQSLWVTATTQSDTAPNAAYSPDVNNVGVNELDSPAFVLPAGSAQLTFRHHYAFEANPTVPTNGFDGGVVEIKIGTNAFTDITNNGGSFVLNGYNRKIDPSYSNPLTNRWAFSGTNSGFVTTTITLPPGAAGQTNQIRWRAGSDNGNSGGGWWVDSILVTAQTCCANAAPTLPNQTNRTVVELTTLTVTNTATSLGTPANPLLYSLVNPPAGASINSNGVITWTPQQNQSPSTNTITTAAVNSGVPALNATNSFTVVVREVNVAPSLPNPNNLTINELVPLTVTNTATNANIHSTILGYGFVTAPSGVAIDANGVITWTPQQTQSPGAYTITTVVTNTNPYDQINPQLTATNSFTVTVREVNVAPVLPIVPPQTVNELTLLTVTNTAGEANIHASLGYMLVNPPAGMTIDTNGIVTWTPQQTQSPGTNTITTVVTNTDAFDTVNPHLNATNTFIVVVKEVNVAPTLPATLDQTVNELTLLTVTNSATNANIHSVILGYALVTAPAGMNIDTNGVITWTPQQNQSPGTNTVTTIVTNSNPYDTLNPQLTATNTFTVVVREVNTAPVLSNVPDQTIVAMTTLTVTNAATNANIHSVIASYTLVNPPSGMNVDANGVITWTPQSSQAPSVNTITTVVTNSNPYDVLNPMLSATNSFVVTVNPVQNTPPPQPHIDSITLSNDVVIISWATVSNQNYMLQRNDDIASTNWTDVPPSIPGNGSTATATDSISSVTQRLYRIHIVP